MEKSSGERRTHLRVTCLLYITALTQRGSTARTQTLHNAPVSPISSSLMILSYWRMSPPLLIECYTPMLWLRALKSNFLVAKFIFQKYIRMTYTDEQHPCSRTSTRRR